MPIWMISGLAVLGAIILFAFLDNGRRAKTAPTIHARTVDGVQMPSALPPLYLGSDLPVPPPPPPPMEIAPSPYQPSPPQPVLVSRVLSSPPPTTSPAPGFVPPQPIQEPRRPASSGDVLVIDTTSASAQTRPADGLPSTSPDDRAGSPSSAREPIATDPIRTTQLRRRATTVVQGTLIPAVLETALDSTRPGQVRAMVSRDVTGFDGSQVLIPRGSRLFGEYEADLAPGQNRAFVQWTRLVRPDGVAIAIESPAADAVGRAGIRGRVDSHFLERFGAAFLQSTLNFGSALAGRSIGGDTPVIVALPGSTQGGGPALTGDRIQPTLRVDAGVTVTVFVAHDLEFPATEARR
tara:strand:- start:40756 stop:41808 length:1053 start_codon:yes stop_codon:yes gene_type:complete